MNSVLAGIFLASSDVVVTGQLEEQIQAGSLFGRDGNAFSLLAHKVSLTTGKDHGIYGIIDDTPPGSTALFGNYQCKFVLQKPSIEKMRTTEDVVQVDRQTGQEYVNCDSSFYFSHTVSRMLKQFQERHLDSLIANRVELDAYRDFLQPLGSQPIGLDEFLASAKSQANVFREMYAAFAGLSTAVIALTNSEFFHLGTVHEIFELYLDDTEQANRFRRAICFTDSKPGSSRGGSGGTGGLYYSRLNEHCQLSDKSLMEFCSVGEGLSLHLEDWAYVNTCRITASELNRADTNQRSFRVPKDTCLHTVAVRVRTEHSVSAGKVSYVTICFQRTDDLKKNYKSLADLKWLGKTLPAALASRLTTSSDSGCSIWSLRVFRAKDTMTESFVSALSFCQSYLEDTVDGSEVDAASGQLYSLFDILRLQSFESMIQIREDMMKESQSN